MARAVRLSAVWLSLALLNGGAGAQVVVPGPGVTTAPDFDLEPDQEVVVREYIIRRRPTLIEPENMVIRPGSIIPGYVELEPFEDAPVPSLRRFAYFVSPNNKIVVVDPATRQVVRILEQ